MRRIVALVVVGLLAGSLAAPATVMAKSGSVFLVGPPNGVNDTAAIQEGLDSCAGAGPGCVVQLAAGTYLSDILLARDFNGTFMGAGMDATTIEALPNQIVTTSDPWLNGSCLPDLATCRLPVFLMFVNGNVTVSDLTLDFPATDGTATIPYPVYGEPATSFVVGLDFTGEGAHDASVARVRIAGRVDTAPTALGGANVAQAIMFDGGYPTAPFPSFTSATRSGRFSVRDSIVRTVFDAVIVLGAVSGSQITVAGNTIDDVAFGLDLGAANSTFDVFGNTIDADFAGPAPADHIGLLIEPSGFAGLVRRLSQFSIHDNTITATDTCGCLTVGMWLQDANPFWGAPDHWFTGTIAHNTISLPTDDPLLGGIKAGIDANNVAGLTIAHNTITAAPTGTLEGIGLWGNDPSALPSTGNSIVGNDLTGLALDPEPGWALGQIFLDAYTSDNAVVCPGADTSVVDWGTDNKVTYCGKGTAKSTMFAHVVVPRGLLAKLHR